MYAIDPTITNYPMNMPLHSPGILNPKVNPKRYSKGGATIYNAIKTIVVVFFRSPSPRIVPIITPFRPSS